MRLLQSFDLLWALMMTNYLMMMSSNSFSSQIPFGSSIHNSICTLYPHVWPCLHILMQSGSKKSHFYIFGWKLEKLHGCEELWCIPRWLRISKGWVWINPSPWFYLLRGLLAKLMVALPFSDDKLICTQVKWGGLSPTWVKEPHIYTPYSLFLKHISLEAIEGSFLGLSLPFSFLETFCIGWKWHYFVIFTKVWHQVQGLVRYMLSWDEF